MVVDWGKGSKRESSKRYFGEVGYTWTSTTFEAEFRNDVRSKLFWGNSFSVGGSVESPPAFQKKDRNLTEIPNRTNRTKCQTISECIFTECHNINKRIPI